MPCVCTHAQAGTGQAAKQEQQPEVVQAQMPGQTVACKLRVLVLVTGAAI